MHGYGGGSYSFEEATDVFFSHQEAFVRGAKAAVDAAEGPIRRLTLRVESANDLGMGGSVSNFLCRSRGWGTDTDVVGDLLSHQAARRVEELRVAASQRCLYPDRENGEDTGGVYLLVSLPSSETLCMLDLAGGGLKLSSSASALPLPRLATLRLRFCSVQPMVLQALLDAAPELTTVQLESLCFLLPPMKKPKPGELDDDGSAEAEPPVLRLNFQQAVSTLVLSLCGNNSGDRRGKSSWAMEIHAPRLQFFKYKGLMRPFVLGPAAPGVAWVDLHFIQEYGTGADKETRRMLFWQFLHNFTNARTIKLKVEDDLKDIAATVEATRARLLCAFPSVERLVLEGVHGPKSKTAAVAIANLLQCCPALGEIVLKLSAATTALTDKRPELLELERKDRSDYNKSIDRFVRRRKSKTAISTADINFGDKYSYDDVPGIPGPSGNSFACLQRTLRRVGLQFRLDNDSISSCLGLRLIKFFAVHARVLEEMRVDTGNRRLNEHLNFNVKTQMAFAPKPISATASIQHKNLEESSSESSSKISRISSATLDSTIDLAKSTAGFTVLPLQRQEIKDGQVFIP